VPFARPELGWPVNRGTPGVGAAPPPGPFGEVEGGAPGGGGALTTGGTGTALLPGGMPNDDCPRSSVLPGGADAVPDGMPGVHHIIVVGGCSVAGAVGSAGAAVVGPAVVAGATLAIGLVTSCSDADTSRASGGDPIG